MTPTEQLAYLKSYAERKPQARLGPAIARLRVVETAEALSKVPEGFAIVRIFKALSAALREEMR